MEILGPCNSITNTINIPILISLINMPNVHMYVTHSECTCSEKKVKLTMCSKNQPVYILPTTVLC